MGKVDQSDFLVNGSLCSIFQIPIPQDWVGSQEHLAQWVGQSEGNRKIWSFFDNGKRVTWALFLSHRP
jgi:hypothetical protein